MKKYISVIVLLVSIFSSCSEIYDPNVNASEDVLVVDGLITDQPGKYTVKLLSTRSFNGAATSDLVISAKVSIFDNFGNTYSLIDTGDGKFVSDSTKFTGIPGRSYTLHIETNGGDIYESDPQLLLSGSNYRNRFYGEEASKDVLKDDGNGGVYKKTEQGVDLLYDITGGSDTTLRFRFRPIITTEYFFIVEVPFSPPVGYYGWYTNNGSNLVNLTHEKYQTSSTDITKHKICFVSTEYKYEPSGIENIKNSAIVNKIIKVAQYRLNEDTYQFYKNANTLLAAEGKLFDPIAFQLKGNIHCVNNPQKLVLGIFEASSLRTNYYVIKPGSKSFKEIPEFNPPTSTGRRDSMPPFWIN